MGWRPRLYVGRVKSRLVRWARLDVALVAAGMLVSSACSTSGTSDVATPTTDQPTPSAGAGAEPTRTADGTVTTSSTVATQPSSTTTTSLVSTSTTSATVSAHARPDWLGTRVLPRRSDGFGRIDPTPPELIDRRFETIDHLPPPADEAFVGVISPIPADVLARATWEDGCPVGVDELRYLVVSHWGFDGLPHTGELIVNAAEAENVVGVFERLHAERFPIEQMRVAARTDIGAPPTGDGNGTGSFVCRPVRGATKWSQHAFGLAIDINPFHNPYARGDVVLPELASAYVDRTRDLPGMIQPDSVAVEAFADIGWSWGGDWNSLKDWMHFSRNGR